MIYRVAYKATHADLLKESQAQTERLADLLATGDVGNRIPVIVADLRKRHPGVENAEVMNYLETAFCPIVAGLTGLSDAEKRARMGRFESGIRLKIYSEVGPRSGDQRRVGRIYRPMEAAWADLMPDAGASKDTKMTKRGHRKGDRTPDAPSCTAYQAKR